MFVVITHNTNEDGWEASGIFNVVYKSIDSAKTAILEDASYMVADDETPDLEWDDELSALAYDGTILYRIVQMEIER